MPVQDEDDLREGLRALSAAPPPQPASRVDASVRRAGRIRRRRAAGTALAFVVPALVAGVVFTRTPSRDVTPTTQDPVLRDAERTAVESWLAKNALREGERVRVLRSARVPGSDAVVVALAACAGDACSRAALLQADARSDGTPDGNIRGWYGPTRDVTPATPLLPMSAYVPGTGDLMNGLTNVLFVLADPAVARAAWSSPARIAGTGGSGLLPSLGDGAFAGDVGHLSAPAALRLSNAAGATLWSGAVGSGGDVGFGPLPGELNGEARVEASGYLRTGPMTHNLEVDTDGELTLLVTCVSLEPLRLRVEGVPYDASCDSPTTALSGIQNPADKRLTVEISGDPYATYRVGIGEPY